MAEMIYLANNDWLENLPVLGAKDPALGAKIALVVTATGFVIVTVLLLFKCFKDDAHLSQYAMAVHPGRVLLTEKSLSRALSKKYNNFKKDIRTYFYDATLHWKTV